MATRADEVITKENLNELFYILPIENLGSVLRTGLLSHNRVNKLNPNHVDVSNPDVQENRDKKIPRADKEKKKISIHRHVNFYLNPHNAMMYVRKGLHPTLCVLRIRREILQRGDVIVSTKNAACSDASFSSVADKETLFSPRSSMVLKTTSSLDFNIMRQYSMEQDNFKQIRQAEILLPYKVLPEFIGGVFVSCDFSMAQVIQTVTENNRLDIIIDQHPSMFFQGKEKYINLQPFTPLANCIIERQRPIPELNMDLPDSDSDNSDSEMFGGDPKKRVNY